MRRVELGELGQFNQKRESSGEGSHRCMQISEGRVQRGRSQAPLGYIWFEFSTFFKIKKKNPGHKKPSDVKPKCPNDGGRKPAVPNPMKLTGTVRTRGKMSLTKGHCGWSPHCDGRVGWQADSIAFVL